MSKNSYKKYSTMISPKALLIFLLASVLVKADVGFIVCRNFQFNREFQSNSDLAQTYIDFQLGQFSFYKNGMTKGSATFQPKPNEDIALLEKGWYYVGRSRQRANQGEIIKSNRIIIDFPNSWIPQGPIYFGDVRVRFECKLIPTPEELGMYINQLPYLTRHMVLEGMNAYEAKLTDSARFGFNHDSEFRKLVRSESYKAGHACTHRYVESNCKAVGLNKWIQNACWITKTVDKCSNHGVCINNICKARAMTGDKCYAYGSQKLCARNHQCTQNGTQNECLPINGQPCYTKCAAGSGCKTVQVNGVYQKKCVLCKDNPGLCYVV